jgi:hypothetical protein
VVSEPRIPQIEMGAGIAASPHCAERRICRCSLALAPLPKEFWPHFSILAHQLRRRFASDNSLQRRSPTGLLVFAIPKECVDFQPVRHWHLGRWFFRTRFPAKTVRRSAALLGSTSLASRFAVPGPKTVRSRVALEEVDSSGASSRLAPLPLRRASAIACRRRSDLWSPAAPVHPCGLSEEAGTAVPIT